jgi:ribonucleotide reductase alpha subunit
VKKAREAAENEKKTEEQKKRVAEPVDTKIPDIKNLTPQQKEELEKHRLEEAEKRKKDQDNIQKSTREAFDKASRMLENRMSSGASSSSSSSSGTKPTESKWPTVNTTYLPR